MLSWALPCASLWRKPQAATATYILCECMQPCPNPEDITDVGKHLMDGSSAFKRVFESVAAGACSILQLGTFATCCIRAQAVTPARVAVMC